VTLDPSAFERIRKLVYERTAIVLDPGKEYLVESRLMPIARVHGHVDVNDLCKRLDGASAALIAEVVEAMTTNETSFFRDHHPFEALKKTILPELLALRAQQRKLRVWCAACSSGQEPYSLAILLAESFPQLASWDVRIDATDVAKAVLARARAGRYRQIEVNRGLSSGLLLKYFNRDGLEWEVKPELKRLVRFQELNLIERWPALERYDLILLRNVLIYFDQQTKQTILAKMRGQLAGDGYLLLGGSETPPPEVSYFERLPIVRAGIYRLAAPQTTEGRHAR
jgi:chemotaxis protein methyltransferase CheR